MANQIDRIVKSIRIWWGLNSVQCLDAEEAQLVDENIQSEVLEVPVFEETNVSTIK